MSLYPSDLEGFGSLRRLGIAEDLNHKYFRERMNLNTSPLLLGKALGAPYFEPTSLKSCIRPRERLNSLDLQKQNRDHVV